MRSRFDVIFAEMLGELLRLNWRDRYFPDIAFGDCTSRWIEDGYTPLIDLIFPAILRQKGNAQGIRQYRTLHWVKPSELSDDISPQAALVWMRSR